jgi:RNA polymerase sigma factor (sigma-70 family)
MPSSTLGSVTLGMRLAAQAMPNIDDVERCKRALDQHLEELCKRLLPAAMRWLNRRGAPHNVSDAEDAMHDAIVAMLKYNRGEGNPEMTEKQRSVLQVGHREDLSRVVSWMLGKTLIKQLHRAAKRRTFSLDGMPAVSDDSSSAEGDFLSRRVVSLEPTQEELAIANEAADQFRACLEGDDDLRNVLAMRMQGYTYREIASTLGFKRSKMDRIAKRLMIALDAEDRSRSSGGS